MTSCADSEKRRECIRSQHDAALHPCGAWLRRLRAANHAREG
ncbi:hypothetical protein HSB1_20080 [Halogranum salarium B-1]|uniref:Uncharacterized protein n=1 Tax=Halogranum salarium B-1 TaxID=1210908 RepID=J2ZGN1_9EURY|nr:hypothetical protein HSB1_20080 [Halogranum salarium B-1]